VEKLKVLYLSVEVCQLLRPQTTHLDTNSHGVQEEP